MQRPSKKSLIIRVMVTVAVLVSACTALRFGYNQAPDLAYWWLDGYVDFDDAQSDRVRSDLDTWFRWHRAQQLPDYGVQLARASQQVMNATTPTEVCRWVDELSARAVPAFERGLPALADLALTLKPTQLKNIAERFEKNNAEFKSDFLQDTRDDRLDAAVERYEDRAEMLYGRLQPAQRERLRQHLAASPFDPQVWLSERRQRQQDLLNTLRRLSSERASREQAQAALRTLFDNARRSPREAYRSYNDKLTPHNCQLAAELHNSTTPEQRLIASRKLRGWQEDLRVLAAVVAP